MTTTSDKIFGSPQEPFFNQQTSGLSADLLEDTLHVLAEANEKNKTSPVSGKGLFKTGALAGRTTFPRTVPFVLVVLHPQRHGLGFVCVISRVCLFASVDFVGMEQFVCLRVTIFRTFAGLGCRQEGELAQVVKLLFFDAPWQAAPESFESSFEEPSVYHLKALGFFRLLLAEVPMNCLVSAVCSSFFEVDLTNTAFNHSSIASSCSK